MREPTWNKRARRFGYAFQHREGVTTQWLPWIVDLKSGAADRNSVSVHINRFVSAARENSDGPFCASFRVPFKFAFERTREIISRIVRRQKNSGMRRDGWFRRFFIDDDDGRASRSERIKFRGKLAGQPNASVTRWVTGEIAAVQKRRPPR